MIIGITSKVDSMDSGNHEAIQPRISNLLHRIVSVASDGVLAVGLEENLYDPESDAGIIYLSLYRDPDHFAKLIERYESAAAVILWRFTQDKVILEELVQNVFVEVFFSLRRFKLDAPFFPWLRTIATRVGYHYWRDRYREMAHQAKLANTLPKPAPALAADESVDYVHYFLGQLAPKDRLVLTLQYLEGCSTHEIAERMGWSESLVKVRAFRARRKLRKLLLEQEQETYENA